MKLKQLFFAVATVAMAVFVSCQKEETIIAQDQTAQNQVSEEVLAKIQQLGFSTENVQRIEEGYLVEGDIVLTNADLNTSAEIQALRVGTEEQYRTTNLVKGLPRVVTVSLSGNLPSSYGRALDEAIRRFNAENLKLTFQKVSSGGNISIVNGYGEYLASAGFPTSGGKPYSQVKVNVNYIGTNPNTNYLATILAHEIGHCIGFRHTDYMNRQYSCNGQYANEGQGRVGAVHIPGTPTGPDANSWMLACIATGVNRPFNSNDKSALGYLYNRK